jgi:dipeptidyl aminopeptidase/acylaminoacyl peptidase
MNKYPLLVMLHGGSFLTGTKESIATLCGALAEKGLIVASINYRLGWDAPGTAGCEGDTATLNEAVYRAMQDLNASLRYLTANADKYCIDKDWIFTGGASAGAVAALNNAYLTDAYASVRFRNIFNKLGSLYNADNNLTNTYSIKGICSMWGGVFDSTLITASNAIPAIMYHGSEDMTIPVNKGTYLRCSDYQTLYGSEYIYNTLSGLGIPAVAHIYEGGGHGPSEYVSNAAFIASTTYCFFEALRSKIPESGMYRQMESNCK